MTRRKFPKWPCSSLEPMVRKEFEIKYVGWKKQINREMEGRRQILEKD